MAPTTRTADNSKVKCDTCQSIFKHRNHLYQHVRSKHLNILHTCTNCFKSYTRRTNMLKHKRKCVVIPADMQDIVQLTQHNGK